MFQIPVIEVPTNLPNIRKDLPIQAFAVGRLTFILYFVLCLLYFNLTNALGCMLFQTARGKWEHVRQEVAYMFRLGRPVLVGTTR